MDEIFFGYVYVAGRQEGPERLESLKDLEMFIKEFIFCEELRITDSSDNLILHVLDGVELFTSLNEYGVTLTELIQDMDKQSLEADAQNKRSDQAKPESPSVKRKHIENAQTVADVAALIDGTYFTALFESEDGSRAWADFDPRDYSVIPMEDLSSENSKPKYQRISLSPNARVRHDGSSAGIQVFILLDPP